MTFVARRRLGDGGTAHTSTNSGIGQTDIDN